MLPEGLAAPATDTAWRHALLSEVSTDLMLARVQAGRGFDLPALAGPSGTTDCKWEERPAESLEGLATKVDAASGDRVADKLMADLSAAVSPASEPSATPPSRPEQLSALATAVVSDRSRWTAASAASTGPALRGGWSLLQEMGIREAALALREEYGVRRQILLRRLDVTVQVMCNCESARVAKNQPVAANVLSSMWAGWRRSAAEAPPLSEWSALAATSTMLTRTMTARVSGPNALKSKVKSIRIGHVPDRGGIPEGYAKKVNAALQAPAPKAGGGSSSRPLRATREVVGGASSSGSNTTAPAGGSTDAAGVAGGAADVSAAPDRPLRVAAKGDGKGKKGSQVGARSTNLGLRNEVRAQQRKEREEGGANNTYYASLGGARPRESKESK